MPETAFTRLLGVRLPLQMAAIGGLAVPVMAAAVADAGGLGMLSGVVGAPDLEAQFGQLAEGTTVGVGFLMPFLAAGPDISPITDLITTWIHIGQALVGSIGALAFIFAFIWKITAVETKSALAAKQWIQRIVVGTIGVEVASSLVGILTSSVPSH